MWKDIKKVLVLYDDRGKIVNLYADEEYSEPIINNTWIPHRTYIISADDVSYLRMGEIPRYIQGLDYLIKNEYEVLDVY